MLNFQNLPDELVLKILSYSEIKDLISCGQLSKRIRRISHDGTLWVTANLEKKIVKTELLEMILRKGCRTLNLCHSTILGRLSSNIKSQLSVLRLLQPVICHFTEKTENIDVLEELLLSCCSLQHLVMEGAVLTPKMAVGIGMNGKTLQILNLNSSDLYYLFNNGLNGTPAFNFFHEIITCCQELKEVDLGYINENDGLNEYDMEFLAKNIPPNVEKLNLSNSKVTDEHLKILLNRCNKIKALSLEETWITNASLRNIRQHLHLTLEELNLGPNDDKNFRFTPTLSFANFIELKSMPKLKSLNLYYEKDDSKKIQNLRQHLPHLMIKGLSSIDH